MFEKKCNHKTCSECGHLFETGGKEVVEKDGLFYPACRKILFCSNCAPEYDSVWICGGLVQLYKKMEVDKNGTPIGYKKIEE